MEQTRGRKEEIEKVEYSEARIFGPIKSSEKHWYGRKIIMEI